MGSRGQMEDVLQVWSGPREEGKIIPWVIWKRVMLLSKTGKEAG